MDRSGRSPSGGGHGPQADAGERSILDHPRTQRIAVALSFALAVAFLVSVLGASGSSTVSGRLGGDYPAFYAAGRIINGPDRDGLYDLKQQQAEQTDLFGPDPKGGVLYFAYPPFLAGLYSPLAALPYRVSYVVHTILMAAVLVLALRLARPMVPILGRRFGVLCALSFAFYPMFRAVSAGQNTPLTLLLLVWAWRALHDGHDAWAGVALGLLLYKPQYAVPMLGLQLVARRWRALLAAALTVVPLWTAGALLLGPGWLGHWWSRASTFATVDAETNAHNAISLLGVAEGMIGTASSAAKALAGPPIVAIIGMLVALWAAVGRRGRAAGIHESVASGPDTRLLERAMLVAVPGIILISPHSMSYDGGLVLLTLLVLAQRTPARTHRWLALAWAAGGSHALASELGVTPLFALVVGLFVWAVASAGLLKGRSSPAGDAHADRAARPTVGNGSMGGLGWR